MAEKDPAEKSEQDAEAKSADGQAGTEPQTDAKDDVAKTEVAPKADTEDAKADAADDKDGKTADAKADAKSDEKDKKDDKAKADKKAEKAARKAKKKAEKAAKPKKKRSFGMPVVIIVAVVCAVLGGLVGHFCLNRTADSGIAGKTTVTQDQLGTVMGTYTYDGKTYNVTVEDVIKQTSSLDSAKQDDGTYEVPSADGVLSVARTQILLKEAEKQGVTVSDDDVDSYAQQNLGSTDYDSIAKQYSMDKDTAKELIRESAIMKKLQDQVVGDTSNVTAPTAPTEPADGNKETANSDYAKYIIGLAGDEWDSAKNTWKDSSSDYATALADYTVTNDSASYEAAEAAYYVAYQKYSQQQSQVSNKWTQYVNGLLQNAHCTLGTLTA